LSAFVFNQNGQLLSTIIDNRLCGTAGSFSWNGFDTKNNRLPAGVYVVLIETFNLSGKTQRLKKIIGIRF
jgi:flagellar hook assembly protein FlgD